MHNHTAIGLFAFTALAGCNPTASNSDRNSAAAAEADSNAPIIAAIEPFEALTEQAATVEWRNLDQLIADAHAKANSVRGRLPAAGARRVDAQLARIAAARAAEDRLGIALASMEGYRAMVESQDPASAKPPIPVSLLDYAGFRYDALARSPSVDWPQMTQTAAFARQQWEALKPAIRSAALVGVAESALSAMQEAARRKDAVFAQSAAATELALVDLIEETVAGN